MKYYDDLVQKNPSQVSQVESALRSLTYILPGICALETTVETQRLTVVEVASMNPDLRQSHVRLSVSLPIIIS